MSNQNTEQQRLDAAREGKAYWKFWGPYLSERQWGTVREDYSPNGNAWDYFSHDQARPAHTVGVRTASPASPTKSNACALWDGCHLFPKAYQIVANLVAAAIRSLSTT